MNKKTLPEYIHLSGKASEAADCITQWMKMFYAMCAAVFSVSFALLKLSLRTGHETDILDHASKVISCAFSLGMMHISVAFAIVIFHKFNTHNRIAGYLSAMTREHFPNEKEENDVEYRIFESCDLALRQSRPGVREMLTGDTEDFFLTEKDICNIEHESKIIQHNNDSKNFFSVAYRIFYGAYMVIRAPVKKVGTRSWRYSYPISFGLLVPTIIGMMVLYLYLPEVMMEDKTTIGWMPTHYLWWGAIGLVGVAWIGMFFRLFRLCKDRSKSGLSRCGDRTISEYCNRAIVERYRIFRTMGIEVRYRKY